MKTYRRHSINITQDTDGKWTFEIDNRVISDGWSSKGMAFQVAQHRCDEIDRQGR